MEKKYVCTECGKEIEARNFLTECDYCLSKKDG
jgi:DNA-directed RNA polymerase subunit RPC12/RpoP